MQRILREATSLVACLAILCMAWTADARAELAGLTVEYRNAPLGIDVRAPRFGWQITASRGERDARQSAWRIRVTDTQRTTVWDSGRQQGDRSIGIAYSGQPLQPATRYDWVVTSWDARGKTTEAVSSFETGLLDPGLAAWEGARWIGGTDDDLVLHAPYLSVFALDYTVAIAPGSQRASLILAANDARLQDRNRNIWQLQRGHNESYFAVELDITPLADAADPFARLNVYRVGYSPTDSARVPVRSFRIRREFVNDANRHADHHVQIRGTFGELTLRLDNSDAFFVPDPAAAATPVPAGPPGNAPGPTSVNLNPAGRGGNFLTFGMLCDIGFAVDAGQQASFRNVRVTNQRSPGNTLFHENLTGGAYAGIYREFTRQSAAPLKVANGAYVVDGGRTGAFVVADPSRNAMPMLRTAFDVGSKAVRSARLYVTARGIYELQLNGKRIGDDYYNPGLTQYNRTHLYQTYDITGALVPGANALGALLGEGWWSGQLSYGSVWNHFGDRQSLLAKLVVSYEDGTRQVVVSDGGTWRYFNEGPVRYSSLNMGEVYDATRERAVEGWSTAAYDDRAWHGAVEVPLAGTSFQAPPGAAPLPATGLDYAQMQLIGQIGEPARIYEVLTAKSVREVRPGVYVYDMGQNFVGVPRLELASGVAGRRVIVRIAEVLYPDLPEYAANTGMIMTENYRAALSQDQYVMRDGAQVFQPRFTSHGYQYIEITGLDAPLPLAAVQGVAISSVQRLTANYESSNEKVNQLWSNLVWSNVGNFLSIPTDCPQRNERMGWSGDLNVFARTATYVSDASSFLQRHMLAMRDSQLASGRFTDIAPVGGGFGGLLWGSAGITVPWESYLQYGDEQVLREHYAAMAAYIDYLEGTIDPATGLSSDSRLGDWLGPQNVLLGPELLATAYHVYSLEIMVHVAHLLGREDDETRYRQMHAARQTFFNRTFVGSDGKAVVPDRPPALPGAAPSPFTGFRTADGQSAYAVGLALGAFNEANTPAMQANLAAAVSRENQDDQGVARPANSLMTGFIGTAWISKALSDGGRTDLAYRLLQNDQYPSWLYPVDQGATTIWERLNSYTVEAGFGGNNSMNSFNHYSFGAVGQWLVAHSLGIQRDTPGFRTFILRPEPDPTGGMRWARGHYDSVSGRIESAWRVEQERLEYTVTVPANTTATLHLPTSDLRSVRENGSRPRRARGATFLRFEDGRALYRLGSGTYTFTATLRMTAGDAN